eukprot:12427527-Karenia_brevis.AAC.1
MDTHVSQGGRQGKAFLGSQIQQVKVSRAFAGHAESWATRPRNAKVGPKVVKFQSRESKVGKAIGKLRPRAVGGCRDKCGVNRELFGVQGHG